MPPITACMWSWLTDDAEAGHTHRCGRHRDHKGSHVCGVKFGKTRACGAVQPSGKE